MYSVAGVTILLSLTVFLNLVAETLPQVSDAIPLLGTDPFVWPACAGYSSVMPDLIFCVIDVYMCCYVRGAFDSSQLQMVVQMRSKKKCFRAWQWQSEVLGKVVDWGGPQTFPLWLVTLLGVSRILGKKGCRNTICCRCDHSTVTNSVFLAGGSRDHPDVRRCAPDRLESRFTTFLCT